MHIGSWVRRERGSRHSRGHLVESVVSHDAVVRCGRRMRDDAPATTGRLVVHDGPVSRASRPLDWTLCRGCV